VLIVLLLAVAYTAFSTFFEPVRAVETPPPPEAVEGLHLAKVGLPADYSVIKENGLFGPAAESSAPDPAAAVVAAPTVEVTRLPLKLLGTAATSPTDPLACAGIKNTQTNSENTYYLGEPVLSDVVLEEVHKRGVVLFNKKENKREILSMDEKETIPAHLTAVSGAAAAPQPADGGEPGPVSIKKDELMEIASDMGRLMMELKPQPYKDESGKMIGITSPDLGKVPLAKKVGLADNDVITAINGMSIDSVESIGKIAEKFKNLNVFHLKVLRNGQTVTRTIKLD
jgi:type II secretory pathway component PulC